MAFVRSAAFAVFVTVAHGGVALAQISPVLQERFVQASGSVSSGASDTDQIDAPGFGPFAQTAGVFVTGAAGASSSATAAQNSAISPTLISASLGTQVEVHTGTTFVTADADGLSSFLYIFNLAAPTPVEFDALGQVSLVGQNPDGEPSDLYGRSSVRLINAITEDVIAAYQINNLPGTDSAEFNGVLPAGQYAILARAELHAFSADLLGPPARSGSGIAGASFSLSVVPAPAAAPLLGLGLLAVRRRR